MKLRRIGLYYMFTYLTLGGFGFLFFPNFSLHLALSSIQYDEIPLRFAGMVSIMFGFLIYQVIQQRLTTFDVPTVFGRLFVLAILVWFYVISMNPVFLYFFVVVFVGLIITCMGLLIKE